MRLGVQNEARRLKMSTWATDYFGVDLKYKQGRAESDEN